MTRRGSVSRLTELISEEQVADAYFDLNRGGLKGRRHFTTAGGCLGWDVPNAIGAKIAQPDRQVVEVECGSRPLLQTVASGRPSVVDVKMARRFGGADSTWFDFFSVARGLPRQT